MKNIHLLILVVFGFFLIPTVSFACGSHSAKSCCSKKISTNSEKKDCCKKDNHSKKDSQHSCNGKCGHSNCVTTSPQFSAVFFELKFNHYDFSFSGKRQNFYNHKTNISSGFSSLWLIPKIG